MTGAASVYPAYTFKMSTRDLARFALLYLNGGKWHDRQIVPNEWVAASTRAYSQTDAGLGYGYLWWTPAVAKLPQGTFFAAGAGDQFAFIIPPYDLVVIYRAARSPESGPGLREISRLLQLVLEAAPSKR